MSSAGDASFAINLEGNAAEIASTTSTSLEQLRAAVYGSEEAIKSHNSTLRRLKGSTEEIRAAKDELKAKIQAEQAAIAQNTLAIVKQGTSYDALSEKAKKLAADKKKMTSDAFAAEEKKLDALISASKKYASGAQATVAPTKQLKEGLDGAKVAAGGAGEGMLSLASVAGLLATALAAAGAASVSLGIAFAKWVLGAGNAARSMQLMREAALGSAQNAANLGTHVDDLAKRVATPKEKLNELAVALSRTRLSGDAIVDTFNLVGQAGAAMGDDVGNTLKDIVTRGQQFGRMQLNPAELFGTGLDFTDVAMELAKGMGVSVEAARAALLEGRVKLDDGAKALRKAVESRFGDINMRKMLDLNVIADKFRENLSNLTKGVNLEPVLKSLSRLAGLFDESSMTGKALKFLVTTLGNVLGESFVKAEPALTAFFKGLIIAVLRTALVFKRFKDSLKDALGDNESLKRIDWIKTAMFAAKVVVGGLVVTMVSLAAAVAVVVAPLLLLADAFETVWDWGEKVIASFDYLKDEIDEKGWEEVGKNILEGLAKGIESNIKAVTDAVKGVIDKIKSTFTGDLKIHSPSKLTYDYGQNTGEGYVRGLKDKASSAADAVDAVATFSPSRGASGTGAGGRVTIHVQAEFNFNGASREQASKALDDSSLRAKVTQLFRDSAAAAGLETA
jgi:hypothetical protein